MLISENVHTAQSNLKSQYALKIPLVFVRYRTNHLKIWMVLQNIPKPKAILRKNIKTEDQSYSNQNSMMSA